MRPDRYHDAFAAIRGTIRDMNMVAIGRVVLTGREHIIALEPLQKGLPRAEPAQGFPLSVRCSPGKALVAVAHDALKHATEQVAPLPSGTSPMVGT